MRAHSRSAFTLAEVLIALALLALVYGAVASSLVRQQRIHHAVAELSELQGHLRDGAAILAAALRGASPAGGDIYPGAMLRHSIEFRSTFGASVACSIQAPDRIQLPPNAPHSDSSRLSYIVKRPAVGDGILVFDEGASEDDADDSWLVRTIIASSGVANPCAGSPYITAADAALQGLTITLDSPLPASVGAGAPLRFVERVRYALYQSSDSKWYLGFCASSSMKTGCATLQPLSGPYRPPNAIPASGLSGVELIYFDNEGEITADRLSVARIDMVLRAVTPRAISRTGEGMRSQIADSVRLSIALRNGS